MQEIKSLAELQSLVASKKAVFVDFYATWCGPCKAIAPFVEQKSKENTKVAFAKVNVDVAVDAAQAYGINAMPTFIGFLSGVHLVPSVRGADKVGIGNLVTHLANNVV